MVKPLSYNHEWQQKTGTETTRQTKETTMVLNQDQAAEMPCPKQDEVHCISNGCPAWRWVGTQDTEGEYLGYCGLAGEPKVMWGPDGPPSDRVKGNLKPYLPTSPGRK